ncbi:unnamed protein product [Discula destructiva]
MSGWGLASWFGGSSAQAKKNSSKNAIVNLRSQLDMLQKREKHLRNQATEQHTKAATFLAAGDRKSAGNALKREKIHQHTLGQTQAQIGTLESQILAIEDATINSATLEVIENATKSMKQTTNHLTIEKVEKITDDVNEQNQLSQEIANAIAGIQVGDPVDEDELDAELEALQEENDKVIEQELTNKMLNTGNVPVSDQIQRVPAVPTGAIKSNAPQDSEDEDLKKLMEEMKMDMAV